ncbi:MAG TPA: hypothetical protein VNR20_03320 [Terriglobales bacterium]|nr:hypothetical protein [Terriglobales bacterium]
MTVYKQGKTRWEQVTNAVPDELTDHIGHDIQIVWYGNKESGRQDNVAVECHTCNAVLIDWERKQ